VFHLEIRERSGIWNLQKAIKNLKPSKPPWKGLVPNRQHFFLILVLTIMVTDCIINNEIFLAQHRHQRYCCQLKLRWATRYISKHETIVKPNLDVTVWKRMERSSSWVLGPFSRWSVALNGIADKNDCLLDGRMRPKFDAF